MFVPTVCAGEGFIFPFLPPGKDWRTEFTVANLGRTEAPGLLAFYGNQGFQGLLPVIIDDGSPVPSINFQYSFRLVPGETRSISVQDVGLGVPGYALVAVNPNVSVKPCWVYVPTGQKFDTQLITPYPYKQGVTAEPDYGVVLLNTASLNSVEVTLEAIDPYGVVASATISLPFGEPVARFLRQLLPGLPPGFSGGVYVNGNGEAICLSVKNFE